MSVPGSRQRQFDVVVVGDLNPDLFLQGNSVPAFGQVERLVDDATLTLGGSAGIFACGAARLGLRVSFIGKVGDDFLGHYLVNQLSIYGIDTSAMIVDPSVKTGLTVLLTNDGDRALLTFPGAIEKFSLADLDLALLSNTRHLHIGSYFLLRGLHPGMPELISAAHQHEVTISLDTNYDPLEKWTIDFDLEQIDLFLPNEVELEAITKCSDTENALETLAERIFLVAVKRGARGAIARTGNRSVSANPIPVNALDTTGAGDSFDAGFVYGYLQQWPLENIVRFATACGSLSTRAVGGVTAQPSLTEVLSALSSAD